MAERKMGPSERGVDKIDALIFVTLPVAATPYGLLAAAGAGVLATLLIIFLHGLARFIDKKAAARAEAGPSSKVISQTAAEASRITEKHSDV